MVAGVLSLYQQDYPLLHHNSIKNHLTLVYLHNAKPPKVYSLSSMQVIWFYSHMIIDRVFLNTLLQHGKIIWCGL